MKGEATRKCDEKCRCKGLCSNPSDKQSDKEQVCSCGRHPGSTGNSCAYKEDRASRCKCFLNRQPCTNCNCVRCGNPFGAQPSKNRVKRCGKDNVTKYSRRSTEQYIKDQGGSLSQGAWTDDESILLIVLLKIAKDMDISDDKIQDLYAKYLRYQETVSNGLHIREKSAASVKAKIKIIRQHDIFG